MHNVWTLQSFSPHFQHHFMSLILILFLCLPAYICHYHPEVHHHSSFDPLWQSSTPSDLSFPTHSGHESKLSDLTALIADSYFFGGWGAEYGVEGFDFQNQRGFCIVSCRSSSNCMYAIQLFDGPFKTGDRVTLLYDPKKKADFSKANSSVTYTDQEVELILRAKMHGVPQSCNTTTNLYFINISNGQPFVSPDPSLEKQFFGIQFEVQSPQCNFSFITTVMVAQDSLFDDQVIPYIIVMVTFALIEGGTCIFLLKSYQEKEILGKRISKGTLAIMNGFCFYLTLFNAYWFLNPVTYYALISILYGCIAFIIWPRLIWRVTVIHIKRVNPRRKAKAVVQAYFWMLTIVVIPLLTVSVNDDIIYYVSSLALVPQIIHNYRHSRKYHWNFWLIGCIVVPKIFFIVFLFSLTRTYHKKVYVQGDFNNLFRVEPNMILAAVNLGGIFMQCLVLLIQTRWPRLGNELKLPYEFLLEKEVNPSEEVCPVCLEDLKKTITESQKKSLIEEGSTGKYRKMIITPCKHRFHEACLMKWLKTKTECPNCRQNLPIIEDEESY